MGDPFLAADDYNDYAKMLAEIDRDGEGLTGWELGFVDDLMRESERKGWCPSHKQQDIIERMHRERIG